jgi:hypothetical protein
MRYAFNIAQAHRQHGLGPFQRLALALLVHAEHNRVHRRIKVEPHDIAELLDEEGIGRELEGILPMRLKAKGREVAMDARLGDARRRGHRADAPMGRSILGLRLQGSVDQLGDLLVGDRARRAGPQFVVEARDPALDESPPPFAYSLARWLSASGTDRDRAIDSS